MQGNISLRWWWPLNGQSPVWFLKRAQLSDHPPCWVTQSGLRSYDTLRITYIIRSPCKHPNTGLCHLASGSLKSQKDWLQSDVQPLNITNLVQKKSSTDQKLLWIDQSSITFQLVQPFYLEWLTLRCSWQVFMCRFWSSSSSSVIVLLSWWSHCVYCTLDRSRGGFLMISPWSEQITDSIWFCVCAGKWQSITELTNGITFSKSSETVIHQI